MTIRPRAQNVSEKIGEESPARYTSWESDLEVDQIPHGKATLGLEILHGKATRRLTKDQVV